MYQSKKTTANRKVPFRGSLPFFASLPAGIRSAGTKIGAAVLIGAMLPLMFIDSVPVKFDAETRLKVEGASEAALSDAVKSMRSTTNLDNLVHALNLGRGGEFAVDRPTVVRVVSDIVSGEGATMSQAENRLRDRLSQAIVTTYERRTGQLTISVTAEEAEDAARIANMLGNTFRDEISVSATTSNAPVVEQLRQTLDRAEAALSGFMAETGEQKLAELRRAETAGHELAADMQEAEQQLAETRQRAAQAAALKLEDVLNKPLPDSLDYTGLDYNRQRHVEAKLAVDQLAGDLGPRHPRLLAAQSALADVRNEIQTSLKQLVTSLRQQESAASKRLADLKARQAKKPDDKEISGSTARLAMLEATASEARQNYVEALNRSANSAKASAVKVQVLTVASADNAQRLGPSLPEIMAGGGLVGFFLGTAFAFLTRRKSDVEHDDEFIEEQAEYSEPRNLWREEEQQEPDTVFADPRNVEYDEPVYEPAYQPERPLRPHYPAAANDTSIADHSPLADQVRELLMANRRPSAEASLPPLVAAVMAGRVSQQPTYSTRPSQEEARKAEEVRELRRHMAELRERVETYSSNRSASRR